MTLDQITHEEIDGEILPPDPDLTFPKGDPNAPHFARRIKRDDLNPHEAPTVLLDEEEVEEGDKEPEETPGDGQVGQLEFRAPMPKELRDLADKLRADTPYEDPATQGVGRKTVGFLNGRGNFKK